jgi:hypothetical protein
VIKSEIESFFFLEKRKDVSLSTETLNTYEFSLSLSLLSTPQNIYARVVVLNNTHTNNSKCRLHSPAVVVAVTAGSSAACEV